jgi:hypothetical protein
MHGFNYSRKEYLNLYKKAMPRSKLITNYVQLQRPDQSRVAL